MNVDFNKFIIKLKQPVLKEEIKRLIILILIFLGVALVGSFFISWIAVKINFDISSLFILASAFFLGNIIKEKFVQYNIWYFIISLVGFLYIVSFFLNAMNLWFMVILNFNYYGINFKFLIEDLLRCFYFIPILVDYYILPFFSASTYIYIENLFNFVMKIVVLGVSISLLVRQVIPKNPLLLLDYNQNLLDNTEFGRKQKENSRREEENNESWESKKDSNKDSDEDKEK